MRLIDADKLHYIKVRIANGYDDVKKDIVVFAKEIDKLAKKTECFGKWIPVTERMPEDGEFVFAYSKQNTYKYEGLHISIQYFCNQCWWKEVFTHWMPMPEPPEEEE